MKLQPGDHICSLYATSDELVSTVSAFLAEGLARKERCWYVPSGCETQSIRAAMECRGIDVAAESRRSTLRVFSEAIEQALNEGFTQLSDVDASSRIPQRQVQPSRTSRTIRQRRSSQA